MVLHPYSPHWPQQFAAICAELTPVLGDRITRIEHIGSTAVPGLAAKPIIDLDIVMRDRAVLPEIVARLAAMGYVHTGDQGIPEREVFKRRESTVAHPVLDGIRHHLYACPPDGRELARHLRLRDYLRAQPAARDAYQALKAQIAEAAGQDPKAYARRKEEEARAWVEAMLAQAMGSMDF